MAINPEVHTPTAEEYEDLFIYPSTSITFPKEKETISIDLSVYDIISLTYTTNQTLNIELKKKGSE